MIVDVRGCVQHSRQRGMPTPVSEVGQTSLSSKAVYESFYFLRFVDSFVDVHRLPYLVVMPSFSK